MQWFIGGADAMNLGRGLVGGIAKGFACSRWVRDAALATLLSIIAAASWATPVGWAGVAWIKSLGGQPAICIPQGATQDFPVVRLALAESYVSHGAVWLLRLKSGAAPRVLTSGECMSFGKAVPGYEFSGGSRPIAFKDGSVYSIVINRVNDEEHYNHSYFTTFCAKRKAGGEFDYIQYDESASVASVKSAATRSQSDMPAPQGWAGQPNILNKAGKPAICLPEGAKGSFRISRWVLAKMGMFEQR